LISLNKLLILFFSSKKHTIEEARQLAKTRNGECLSKVYTPYTKLLWKCMHGHEWETLFKVVKRASWCPHCNDNIMKHTCRKILEFIYKIRFING